jgi:hypothetical protein
MRRHKRERFGKAALKAWWERPAKNAVTKAVKAKKPVKVIRGFRRSG